MGDSAGGSIVANALVAMRDRKLPLPAGAILLSPIVDLGSISSMLPSPAKRDIIDFNVLGPYIIEKAFGGNLPSSDTWPLQFNLFDLCPLLVIVGSEESLLDSVVAFIKRAKLSGVDARLEVFEGMFHVFPLCSSLCPEAVQSIDQCIRFVLDCTGVWDKSRTPTQNLLPTVRSAFGSDDAYADIEECTSDGGHVLNTEEQNQNSRITESSDETSRTPKVMHEAVAELSHYNDVKLVETNSNANASYDMDARRPTRKFTASTILRRLSDSSISPNATGALMRTLSEGTIARRVSSTSLMQAC
mmetsp:Transcript_31037/g.52271  ORF Transcript_31037/g.52271 Transcript_31037/m.52271 type:complete len:302 (-) Transcript_31037:565-1470(-)